MQQPYQSLTIPNGRYDETGLLTASMHMELAPEGPNAINLVVGGASNTVKFPLPTFLHLEDRESRRDEAQVELVINPPAINFPANKFVSNWQPIAEMFRYLDMTAQHRDTVCLDMTVVGQVGELCRGLTIE